MKRLFRFCASFIAICVVAAALYGTVAYVYSRHVATYEYQLEAWPPRSEFGDPVRISTPDPKRVRILAIEGGAMRGLADLEVLKALEEKSGKPIHELFDFFAGSSTGAIISALMLNPQPHSGKPLTAEEAISAYEEFGGQILSAPLYHRVLSGFGVLGPALTNAARIKTAQTFLGEARFKDLLRPAMFPAYSEKTGGLTVFRNWDRDEANLYLWPVVTAVTSVPSVFPAVVLSGEGQEDYFYGDAALISNDPADLAYLYARTHLPDVEEFVIVSLETRREFAITRNIGVRGGLVQWFSPAFHLLYRGEVDVAEGALERHARFDSNVDVSLTVLSPVMPPGLDGFDPAQENIALIRKAGRDYVKRHEKQLDDLVKRLTE